MAYVAEGGKKLQNRMGGTLNERVAAPVSSFAKKMLHKMGWTEGKGLGKSEQGINTHIVAKKRKDEEGLGQEGALAAEMGDQWWAGSLEKTMYKMKMKKKMAKKEEKKAKKEAEGEGGGGEGRGSNFNLNVNDTFVKKKKKKKARKDVKDLTEEDLMKGYVEKAPPTSEELFEATGGARFGMRAQSKQKGKWARSEGDAIKGTEEALVDVEWDGLGQVNVSDIVKKDEARKKKKKKRKLEEGGEVVAAVVEEEEEGRRAEKKQKKEKKEKKEKMEKKEKKEKDKDA
ncbi:hypothetical protein TL16_g11172 [Triparma laevis f. inornata]|uniref:G-patch domain-containing protein n=1 Tax=Triparma laevis f. inornata TaxID=1714386 RepID=A0A9W7ER45_9STRA|nr:hypothetical protein TL16_g11172 [Triparma laevis f. inornata]